MHKDLTTGNPESVLWKFCMLCCRAIHRRKRVGCSGQQLRNYHDLYCICFRLQHRLFCHCLSAVRGQRIPAYENCCIHSHAFFRSVVHRFNAVRTSWLYTASSFDSDHGCHFRRFKIVPEHLHMGISVSHVLQYSNRYLLRPRRF